MKFVAGTRDCLPSELIHGMGRYRHKVFIERLGWQLGTRDGLEFDQFDHAETLYVVAQDKAGGVIGTARLLPTTKPYLISEIYPHVLDSTAEPSSEEVWELSRFAAGERGGERGSDRDGGREADDAVPPLSTPLAVDLLRSAIECAQRRGAKTLLALTPIGAERLLRRAGFDVKRAGRPTSVDGRPVVACRIACRAAEPAPAKARA